MPLLPTPGVTPDWGDELNAAIQGLHVAGTHAARPSSDVETGTLYSCADHNLIYRWDGSAWGTWATLGASGFVTAELAYAERTTDLNGITAASTAPADVEGLATGDIEVDGPIMIEAFAVLNHTTTSGLTILKVVDEAGAHLFSLTKENGIAANNVSPRFGRCRLNPTPGTKSFKAQAWHSAASGSGGLDVDFGPAYIRVTRA